MSCGSILADVPGHSGVSRLVDNARRLRHCPHPAASPSDLAMPTNPVPKRSFRATRRQKCSMKRGPRQVQIVRGAGASHYGVLSRVSGRNLPREAITVPSTRSFKQVYPAIPKPISPSVTAITVDTATMPRLTISRFLLIFLFMPLSLIMWGCVSVFRGLLSTLLSLSSVKGTKAFTEGMLPRGSARQLSHDDGMQSRDMQYARAAEVKSPFPALN